MSQIIATDRISYNVNLPANQTYVYIVLLNDANSKYINWKGKFPIHWSKYQIKETDRRQKTASFTSPNYLDLTNGQYCVLIASPYHENFSGVILDDDYDEKTGLYSYKCQDWSRKYISKVDTNIANATLYDVLRVYLSNGICGSPATASQLQQASTFLSGLRPADDYAQEKWGSIIRFNPMTQNFNAYVRGKPMIEVIRDFVYGTGAYIDVYFNENGIIQIEPYSKDDFLKTGLHLQKIETTDRKVKFDTTNIITGVLVESNDKTQLGTVYSSNLLINLDLSVFFGKNITSIANPNAKTENSGSTKSTSSSGSNPDNPYGNKAKKIWINADNGSGSMKNAVANLLKQKGWTVRDGGTCSNCHYSGYFDVTNDYQVYATLYNGFCAGTIREAYSSKIQNVLKNKGVVLVVMWDTSGWTNPNGMKPYRYGDFSGYNASRAWDDNFSSSDPSIKNVAQWLKKNNAIYCANPTADGIVTQFLAGGYFKYANK